MAFKDINRLKEYEKAYRKSDKRKAYMREYNKKYRETHNNGREDYMRNWRNKNKNYLREKWLMQNYNITIADYNRMFAEQNGECKICRRHQSQLDKKLFVDHDHKTGKVRGLLCCSCNLVIGNANDNMEILQSSIEYLRNN